jgi:hypothetical protein
MEVQALKLLVTEDEVNELIKRHLTDTGSIENLRVRLTPEGVVVQGEYPTFLMKMAFETVWELTAVGPELQARLAALRVKGLPAGLLKGVLMGMIRDTLAGLPGVQVQDDAVCIHAVEAALAHTIPLRVCFTAVRCSIGALVLEAKT